MESPRKRSYEELGVLVRLAGPLILVSLGIQLMSVVDTAVVGRLSPVALAAAGLGSALFFTPSVLGFGVMMGLDPLIAQAVGAQDWTRARHLVAQSSWLALAVTLCLLPPLYFLPSLLPHLGVPVDVIPPTRSFFRLRLLSLLPTLLLLGGRSYLQALGHIRPLVTATIVANVLNLAGDTVLVFGGGWLPGWLGPLRHVPALGVNGAAISTAVCSVAQMAWVGWAIRRRGERLWGRLDPTPLLQAVRVGLPVGLQMAAEYGVFALAGVLVSRLGPPSLAAHQVALQLASFTFMGASGLASAGSVRVGLQVGAQNLSGVRRAGLLTLGLAGAWMGVSALALLAFPRLFAWVLTDQAEVLSLAVPLLMVVAAFQLSDGVQAVGAGLLRGAGDTRFAFLANVAGHYLLGLPLGLWLGIRGGMGVIGVWWGLALGLTVVAFALVIRFLRLAQQPIRPLSAAPLPQVL